jgi:hypothetical protein
MAKLTPRYMEKTGNGEEFNRRFLKLMEGWQKKSDTRYEDGILEAPKLAFKAGGKYIKIWSEKTKNSSQRFVCGFVDTSGLIWRAASWKAPALNQPRASIYDDDYGLAAITDIGTVRYL